MRFTVAQENNPIQGALLRAMANSGELTVASLRALSPLSDKAQVLIDKAVVNVGLQRLVIAADLMAAGLTFPLTDPLSVTELEWEAISKSGGAQRQMSPSARGENQITDRVIHRLPIYLTTDDFFIGVRTLKMSQRVGIPIDTTLVEQATRRVNESIEDAVINGSGVVAGGYSAPGLLNAPNAATISLTAPWATATGAQIFTDTEAAITKLQQNKKFGPYNMYVGTVIGNALDADFKSFGTLSIKQRLLQIDVLKSIKIADQMPATQILVIQMTNDVVEIVNGQPPTVIPWTSLDGFTLFWLVMAIVIPRVRSDYDGNSGVCIGS